MLFRAGIVGCVLCLAVSGWAYSIGSSYNAADGSHSNDWWQYTLAVGAGDTSNENVFRVNMAWRIDPDTQLSQITDPGADWTPTTYQAAGGFEHSYVEWRYTAAYNLPTGSYVFEFMDNPSDAIDVYNHIGPTPGGQATDPSSLVMYQPLVGSRQTIFENYGDDVPMTPEPGTLALMLLGGVGLGLKALRRRG